MKKQIFSLIGYWDNLEEISTERRLVDYLHKCAGSVYMVHDLTKPPEAPGNLKDDQGNPFKDFKDLRRIHIPLGLSGTYVVCGIETPSNLHPKHEDVALDKQGNPLTVEIVPATTVYNILVMVTTLYNSELEEYPDHCYFEKLDVDPENKTLCFHMGS